jgi:multimeric flavodoxin WrbA
MSGDSEKSYDYSGLKAVVFNCTLKKGPAQSNTDGLISVVTGIMQKHGVETEVIRAIDHDIATGVYPDMREHGWESDAWPELFKKIKAADIVILAGPIWLGDNSSVMKQVIERLYAHSGDFNDKGQYVFYNKVGGSIITGNEDGGKHCSMDILYSLQHIGFTVPPNADVYWVGPAGPGPSYLEEGSGGPQSEFTNRNATFMAWNLMHMAQLLKNAGGIPAYGTSRKEWDAGTRFDFENPEYR